MTLYQAAVALFIGTGVGVVPGLFGVGGGFILVPALTLLAGFNADIAIGSATSQTLGPTTAGLLHRKAAKRLMWQLPLSMYGGTLVGVVWGLQFIDWAAANGDTWHLAGRDVPKLEVTLMACYFVLLLILALVVAVEWYYSRGLVPGTRRGWLERYHLPPQVELDELDGRTFSVPVIALLGLAVGFLSTGLGMGGGVLLVPALVFLVGVSTQRAITATLAHSWLTGLGGAVGHAWAGRVDLRLVALLLVGSAFGAQVGSLIGERLPGRKLRGWFAVLILIVAVIVGLRLENLIWG